MVERLGENYGKRITCASEKEQKEVILKMVIESSKGCWSVLVLLFSIVIIAIGYFVDIPSWIVYGAGVMGLLAIIFMAGFNIAAQIKQIQAGKTFFPKTSTFNLRRALKIAQGITLLLAGCMRLTVPALLQPAFASRYASNDLLGIFLFLGGIATMIAVEHSRPQIAERGVFDLKDNFYSWHEIENFVWEKYAGRLTFKLKNIPHHKIMVDGIPPEIRSQIYPYLEHHINGVQITTQ